jgi:hypothetical protein
MKNAVFRYVTPCGSCMSRGLGGIYHFHHQGDKNRRTKNKLFRLLVTANIVLIPPILVILMMEAICTSKSSVLTKAKRHNFPENYVLN